MLLLYGGLCVNFDIIGEISHGSNRTTVACAGKQSDTSGIDTYCTMCTPRLVPGTATTDSSCNPCTLGSWAAASTAGNCADQTVCGNQLAVHHYTYLVIYHNKI